jgi:hypothetical protein
MFGLHFGGKSVERIWLDELYRTTIMRNSQAADMRRGRRFTYSIYQGNNDTLVRTFPPKKK